MSKFVPTQSQIDMMKTNKEAFMFWPKELQDWAKANIKDIIFASGAHLMWDELSKDGAYRLRPDFSLPPVKRWFVCIANDPRNGNIESPVVATFHYEQSAAFIEITESELAYYKRPDHIDGFEWRLMKPDGTVEWIAMTDKGEKGFVYSIGDLKFPRWCKVPVKVAGWKEYKVIRRKCGYVVDNGTKEGYRLDSAANSPECLGLFGGVQYAKQENKDVWYMDISAYRRSDGFIHVDNNDVALTNKSLAIPCKARFWSVS